MTDRAEPRSPASASSRARLALAPAAALTLALGACSRAINPTPAPEPQPYAEEPPPPLLGEAPSQGPKGPDETGLLGGPPAPGAEGGAEASATIRFRRPDGVVVSTMKTIPDPEPAPAVTPPRQQGTARRHTRLHGRIDRSGAMTVTAAPRVVTPAPAPTTAIAPMAPAAPAEPAGDLAKAPQSPFVHVLPLTAPSDSKLASLQASLAGGDAAGAKFSVGDAISKGLAGEVELRLPAGLAAKLKAEAAKLGLGAAARTAEVSARLSGEGYQIDPSGPQTAALKPDEEIVFNWRVVPGENAASGPLKAEADMALTGAGAAKTFALAAVDQTPAPAPPPAKPVAATRGQTQAKWALAIILILLAVMVLAGVWRNYKDRRRAEAERRQRERAARAFAEEPAAEPARSVDGSPRLTPQPIPSARPRP